MTTPTALDDSLIEYPCHFPIKVMGLNQSDFVDRIVQTVVELCPDFTADHVTQRPSSKGNYLGLTLSVYVLNREQLDNVYRRLTAHELVKYVI